MVSPRSTPFAVRGSTSLVDEGALAGIGVAQGRAAIALELDTQRLARSDERTQLLALHDRLCPVL